MAFNPDQKVTSGVIGFQKNVPKIVLFDNEHTLGTPHLHTGKTLSIRIAVVFGIKIENKCFG